MAHVVLGLGTSHAPFLNLPLELWGPRAGGDKAGSPLALIGADGRLHSYHELVEMAGPSMAKELTPEVWQTRYDACQRGIGDVAQALADSRADVLIIVGDDQEEIFSRDNMPALCVYWGDDVLSLPHKVAEQAPDWVKAGTWGFGERERRYPVAAGLGRHIVEQLTDAHVDVAHMRSFNGGNAGDKGIGHAFGFVFRRIMGEHVIPTIPIFLNTYYPPNQPTPLRCYEIGRALRRAVESWPGEERVAVIASGGLSHIVVDEEIDRWVLDAFRNKDVESIAALPRERLNSGTSEIRNWILTAGAVEHLDMELFDYVPGYRTPAATGVGMAFARWT